MDRKISDLTDGTPAQAGDLVVVARSGANYKLPLSGVLAPAASDTQVLFKDSAAVGGIKGSADFVFNDTLKQLSLRGAVPAVTDVAWTEVVGCSLVGSTLTKTVAGNNWLAGARGVDTIAAGDGYVEWTVHSSNGSLMCGLGSGTNDFDYTTIDFAIYTYNVTGKAMIYESGAFRVQTDYVVGDTLRVAIVAGVVKYYRNGSLIYTSAVSPTYPLYADSALNTYGATISDAVFSGSQPTVQYWKNDLGSVVASMDAGGGLTAGAITAGSLATTGGITSGGGVTLTADVILQRDAAGVLAQRNGVNKQEFRLYGLYTDASNYERVKIDTSGVRLQKAGTGGNGTFSILNETASNLYLGGGGLTATVGVSINNLYPTTDAAVSTGLSNFRWKAGFFGGEAATVPVTVKAHASQTVNLQEWQNSSGTALASVTKDGYVLVPSGDAATPGLAFTSNPDTGLFYNVADTGLYFTLDGTRRVGLSNNNLRFTLGNNIALAWSNDNFATSNPDLALRREAANVLGQYNPTTPTSAQEFRLYNTYTDASNYERGGLKWQYNTLYLGTESAGTGTVRSLVFQVNGVNALGFNSTGVSIVYVGITPQTDATKDLGSSSARWRTGYFGGEAATVPLVVKAHASQTANLQEWQDSSGTALAKVDKDGAITTPKVTLSGGPLWTSGSGTPESVVTAPVGSLYSRTDGGAGTTLYVKESGTGNTGWVAK